MRSVGKTKGNENRRVKAITLVAMMVSMTMLSLIPAASASQITQYAVQRDPHYVDTGDLDCDGDNDIVASSSMGFYLTSMFNDGSGGFLTDKTYSSQVEWETPNGKTYSRLQTANKSRSLT